MLLSRTPSYLRWRLLLCVTLLFSFSAMASRTITDQTGHRVQIPDQIQRAVILQHHTLDIAVELGAQSRVVGVLRNWQKLLGADFSRLAPGLKSLPTPGI
ncbi:TroA family protein [Dongshaea marina]|uniref:hypothetical protein n=1 Tax=Dongshaea marina TaxID=2047966 RepID=UPI0019028C69|nr:hypothetical protein [Dongshaea marina]